MILKGMPVSLIFVKVVRRKLWVLAPSIPYRRQAVRKILAAESGLIWVATEATGEHIDLPLTWMVGR